jgi:type I restriction enzyme S subunit
VTLTKNSEEVKDFAALINLPPGWCWIPFEEITINYDGKRIPITSSARKPGVFPYYGASGIIDYVDGYLFDGDYLLIAEDGANLLSRSTPIAFEANGKFWVNNHAHIVQVPGELIPLSYLKEYFNFTDLRFYISGSAQPKLNQKNLNRIEIPLAPLNEQRRIVAKIEALKARSQRVKEELEAIPALLDQFRQSVLAAAFRGDLTADWREKNPDVEPASELLKRIQIKRKKQYEEESEKANDNQTKKPIKPTLISLDISSVQENDLADLPPTWLRVKLDALLPVGGIFDGPFGSNLKTSDYTDSGIRVIRLENIGRLEFIEEKRAYISTEKYLLLKKHTVYAGDIIFSSFASDSVRVCILPQLSTPAIAKADCFCLRPDSDIVDRKYLALQFSNQPFFEQLQNFTHGATRLRINTTQLKQSEIYLCSLAEQQEIVHRVETFFKVAGCIEQQYKEAQGYLDQLNQSILAKAFRGELVPQDPNDEPASVLLERIRAEREKLDTKKKAKGKSEKKSRKAKPEAAEPEQLSLPGFE